LQQRKHGSFATKQKNKSKQERRSKERKTAKEEKHELQLTLKRNEKRRSRKTENADKEKKNSIAKAKREIWSMIDLRTCSRRYFPRH